MDNTGDSSGLLNSIMGYASQGADIFKNLTGQTKAATPAATPAPATTTSSWSTYLPWVVGGLVLVVVLGLVFSRK